MKNNETDILWCNCTSEFFSQKLIISLKLIKKKKSRSMNSYKLSLLSAGLFSGQQGGHCWFTASPITCVSKLEV